MLELTNEQLERSLVALGIQSGDGLLIHSAIQMLGMPVEGIQAYVNVLQKVTGERGTLVVPTFTLDYPRTRKFDYRSTPSKGMGSLSEFIRQLPGALRSKHPLQSVASLGYHAVDLTGRDTPSAFEEGSVFDQLLNLDFKLLLLGADIQAASMIHYCEANAGVPYRSWKMFYGQVWQNDQWVEKAYSMYARNLDIDPQLQLKPIQSELERMGVWNEVSVNYGKIACCKLTDFVKAGAILLIQDPWIFVANRAQAEEKITKSIVHKD
jgi:aminoglycoside 3-N-acetyltransferase